MDRVTLHLDSITPNGGQMHTQVIVVYPFEVYGAASHRREEQESTANGPFIDRNDPGQWMRA